MLVVSSVVLTPSVHLDVANLLSNFEIELTSSAADKLKEAADIVGELSYKAVGRRLDELMLTKKPSIGIDFLRRTNVLKKFLPEVEECIGVKQNQKYHIDNVYEHCLKVCDAAVPEVTIRWAGLLHDIGKKDTFKESNSNITFHKHEVYSTKKAKEIVARLRLRNGTKIVSLVSHHMYHYTGPLWAAVQTEDGKEAAGTRRANKEEAEEICQNLAGSKGEPVAEVKLVERGWTDKALRRFIDRAGITKQDLQNLSNIPLFSLRQADRKSRGLTPITDKQKDFEKRITEYLERQE